jgi:hypothetical protein
MSNSAQNEKIRAAARRVSPGVVVPSHAQVQPMADGGAYVEAQVWVSEGAIESNEAPVVVQKKHPKNANITIHSPWSSIAICPFCDGIVDDPDRLPTSVGELRGCSECGRDVWVDADTTTVYRVTEP